MREKFTSPSPPVTTIWHEIKDEFGEASEIVIEKTYTNQSKKDREKKIHKILSDQSIPVAPLIENSNDRMLYEYIEGDNALVKLRKLDITEVDTEEWYKEKEIILSGICDWLVCFYLALYFKLGKKWLLGKFDLRNIIFGNDGNIYFVNFEYCKTGIWEEEVAQICRDIMEDKRISKVIGNEIARSFRRKMIKDLNLNKIRVDQAFLKLNRLSSKK